MCIFKNRHANRELCEKRQNNWNRFKVYFFSVFLYLLCAQLFLCIAIAFIIICKHCRSHTFCAHALPLHIIQAHSYTHQPISKAKSRIFFSFRRASNALYRVGCDWNQSYKSNTKQLKQNAACFLFVVWVCICLFLFCWFSQLLSKRI